MMLRLFGVVAIFFGLLDTQVRAATIERSTEEALRENAVLLKSVVLFESETGTCSSTLVAKNILLTAQHCVEDLKTKDRLKLNGSDQFEVVSVSAQPVSTTMVTDREVSPITHSIKNTDLALVLFKSLNCAKSSLKEIKPVVLAEAQQKGRLTNRVLIAGYGVSSPNLQVEKDDGGILRAGYNAWSISDYSQVNDLKLKNILLEKLKAEQEADDALIFHSSRRSRVVQTEKQNETMLARRVSQSAIIEAETATSLRGDSGGPAFAFDEQNHAYLVGVTSEGIQGNSRTEHVTVRDLDSHQLVIDDETPFSQKETLDRLRARLTELRLIDPSQKNLKSYEIEFLMNRKHTAFYASVFNSFNRRFLDLSLQVMKQARDAANYCQ